MDILKLTKSLSLISILEGCITIAIFTYDILAALMAALESLSCTTENWKTAKMCQYLFIQDFYDVNSQ